MLSFRQAKTTLLLLLYTSLMSNLKSINIASIISIDEAPNNSFYITGNTKKSLILYNMIYKIGDTTGRVYLDAQGNIYAYTLDIFNPSGITVSPMADFQSTINTPGYVAWLSGQGSKVWGPDNMTKSEMYGIQPLETFFSGALKNKLKINLITCPSPSASNPNICGSITLSANLNLSQHNYTWYIDNSLKMYDGDLNPLNTTITTWCIGLPNYQDLLNIINSWPLVKSTATPAAATTTPPVTATTSDTTPTASSNTPSSTTNPTLTNNVTTPTVASTATTATATTNSAPAAATTASNDLSTTAATATTPPVTATTSDTTPTASSNTPSSTTNPTLTNNVTTPTVASTATTATATTTSAPAAATINNKTTIISRNATSFINSVNANHNLTNNAPTSFAYTNNPTTTRRSANNSSANSSTMTITSAGELPINTFYPNNKIQAYLMVYQINYLAGDGKTKGTVYIDAQGNVYQVNTLNKNITPLSQFLSSATQQGYVKWLTGRGASTWGTNLFSTDVLSVTNVQNKIANTLSNISVTIQVYQQPFRNVFRASLTLTWGKFYARWYIDNSKNIWDSNAIPLTSSNNIKLSAINWCIGLPNYSSLSGTIKKLQN